MGPELPEIPLNTPFLLSPPGGYVDLSFRGTEGTSLRMEDLSGQAQSVLISLYREPTDQMGVISKFQDDVALFVSPLPLGLTFVGNPQAELGQGRLYLIFTTFTRPRAMRVFIP